MRVKQPRTSGSSSSQVVAKRPLYANRSSQGDPNGIRQALTILGEGGSNERMKFTLQGAGTARLPDATSIGGAYVEWLIEDLLGTVGPQFNAQDLSRFAVFFHDMVALPVATYAAVVTTAGGVADIGNAGCYAMVEQQTLGSRAAHSFNAGAGAGWAARVAGTEDSLARGAVLQVVQGNSTSNWRINAAALCADGDISLVSGSGTAPSTGNAGADGRHTHIAIVVGWNAAAGAVNGSEVTVSLRELHAALRAIKTMRRVPEPPDPAAPGAPISRIILLGDSNSEGTEAGPFSGVAVEAGWVVREDGVNQANYMAGPAPSYGGIPYYIQRAIAAGATSGSRWIARRSLNGQALTATFDTQIRDIQSDVTALGGGDPHLIVIRIGANDAQDATEAALFKHAYRRMILVLRDIYPNAIIVLTDERTTDNVVYQYLGTVNAHKAAVNLEEGWKRVGISSPTTPTLAPLTDSIHFSQAGASNGHEVMANRDFDLAQQLAA